MNYNNILENIKLSIIEIDNFIKSKDCFSLSKKLDSKNKSDEFIKKLDDSSNMIIKNNLKNLSNIRYIISEEDKSPILINKNGKYLVAFDPLDGSSNIDVNLTIGTIFAIYEYKNNIIESGKNIVCAGYSVYSGNTQLIIAEQSVQLLQRSGNIFNLITDNIFVPSTGKIISHNCSNLYINVDSKVLNVHNKLIEDNYSFRYVGSLVADAHRTLIKGGIFLYTGNKKSPNGKIRLLYEAYPMAYIFEKALGYCYSKNGNIIDNKFPKNIHMRTPIILSGKSEFNLYSNL